ncbi:MAG: type II toxin-antitoxin system RelE/ParE family toxin [bacterium]
MVKVRWTREAVSDLEGIFDFIAKDSIQYARWQVENLSLAAQKLESYPRLGRRLPEFPHLPHREIISGNYRIIHRYDMVSKIVHVISIVHGRRQLKRPS